MKNTFVIGIILCLSLTSYAQVTIKIDPNAEQKSVSPYLYGRNNSLSTDPGKVLNINWTLLKDAGVTFFRENGGNNATKYNWRRKLSSHPDWYNNVYANDWSSAAKALQANMPSAQGMWGFQLIGKAAKTNAANFDDWGYNKSQWWEGVNQNLAGGGSLNKTGSKAAIEGNTDLYLENWPADSTVDILNNWFGSLALDQSKLQYWNMDNEPEIWSGTHDDLFSTQPSAEDFMQKYFAVAKKARTTYPNIKLVGPVTANEWQWYRWGSANITADGKTYPWLEYFIKRIAEEQKTSGIKLLDVLDIHYYPSSKITTEVVQYHRVFFDKNYVYPEANGVRTINGGYDTGQTKEYIFARCNEWLEKYLGVNHGVKLGLTESGIALTDPNAVAVWYASTLGEFMKNEVEIFTPWNWSVGMWETLHLFSRYNKKISIKGQSSEEEFVSAYPTINAKKDSMTVVLVNRSTTTTKNTTVNFDNFTISDKNAKSLTIKNLPTTETFVSHTQNALASNSLAVLDNIISVSLPPLSITSIQLTGKVENYIAIVLANEKTHESETFNIFPNPSQEFLEINIEGKAQIFNVKSQEIKVFQEGNKVKINDLQEGIYFIKITNKKGEIFSKKFIKN
ncbi:glycoside hydrolase family 44 protein [Emticicia sp. SJ17W-69]|uniref:glycoside hydrolase family 44 protein n=1 Tax=Emticicia sp. SJ17W-69 TaxID=3421657 RepID=UPI003EB956AD